MYRTGADPPAEALTKSCCKAICTANLQHCQARNLYSYLEWSSSCWSKARCAAGRGGHGPWRFSS